MNKKPLLHDVDITRYIPSLLSVLNNRLSSSASDLYLQNFDVGINEWRIMVVLARQPGISAKSISELAAIHQTVISRSLREMEKKGFIAFDKGKWERLIELTPLGEETYEKVLKIALQREQLLLDGFSAAEREHLIEFLRRMNTNVALVDSLKPNQT